ncbi:MAG: hypothetical protein KDD49_09570 [Bacteroidetes bacterium]|nr:hypothetical protein [Bacteroidota bacterium]
MKLLISGILIAAIVIGFTSCKTKSYLPTNYPKRQLIFGGGGGFSGVESAYFLLENGQIFSQTGFDSTYVSLGKLKKKQVNPLFSKADTLSIDSLEMNAPGNMYYYLAYQMPDSSVHKITWGDPAQHIPENIKDFRNELMQIISELKENNP